MYIILYGILEFRETFNLLLISLPGLGGEGEVKQGWFNNEQSGQYSV